MRALAIIDGEHYPDVVRDALKELPFEFVAAVLVDERDSPHVLAVISESILATCFS